MRLIPYILLDQIELIKPSWYYSVSIATPWTLTISIARDQTSLGTSLRSSTRTASILAPPRLPSFPSSLWLRVSASVTASQSSRSSTPPSVQTCKMPTSATTRTRSSKSQQRETQELRPLSTIPGRRRAQSSSKNSSIRSKLRSEKEKVLHHLERLSWEIMQFKEIFSRMIKPSLYLKTPALFAYLSL